MRNRQAGFLANVVTCDSFVTGVLEYVDPVAFGNERCLRNIINSIQHPSKPGPLFLGVDPHFRDPDALRFAYLRSNESEARELVIGLLPFLLARTSSPEQQRRLEKYFRPGAVARAQDSRWDNTAQRLVTQEVAHVSALIDMDPEFNFNNASVQITNVPSPPANAATASNFEITDSDSVSTFRQTGPPQPTVTPANASDNVTMASVAVTSDSTVVTVLTLDSNKTLSSSLQLKLNLRI